MSGRVQLASWDVSGPHIAERTALFVLIALGEGLLVTGFAFVAMESSLESIIAMFAAFVAAAAAWWIYFDHGERIGAEAIEAADEPGRLVRTAYTWVHLAIIAGIVLMSVGDKEALGHPHAHTLAATVVTLGGPLLFLVGTTLFRRVLEHRWARAHVLGILGILVLGRLLPAARRARRVRRRRAAAGRGGDRRDARPAAPGSPQRGLRRGARRVSTWHFASPPAAASRHICHRIHFSSAQQLMTLSTSASSARHGRSAGRQHDGMPRPPAPLPSHLGDAFSRSQALAAGVTPRRLRAKDLEVPFRGVRFAPGRDADTDSNRSTAALDRAARDGADVEPLAWDRAERERVLRKVRAYREIMPPHAFFAGRTAAVIRSLPIAHGEELEVAVYAPARAARRSGIRGIKVAPAIATVHEHLGCRLTSPASTWAMLAHELSVRELVRIGDAIVSCPARWQMAPPRRARSDHSCRPEVQQECPAFAQVADRCRIIKRESTRSATRSPPTARTSAIRPHQHSMTLTASPPSLVSLYLCDMSMPVCRIVSTTASSET